MHIDDLISEVAREITSSVGDDFSARVRNRIADSDRRSQRFRTIGAVTGLIATTALAVFVVRTSLSLPTALPDVPRRADAGLATAAPVVEPPVVTAVAAQTIGAKKRSAPPPPAVPTAEEEWLARAVPALERTKPLTIEKPHAAESIQPASLQIPLMGVDVIGTDPLSIAPIGGKDDE